MLYLASQFAWFLLSAFALGLAMGWISHDGSKTPLWSGAWVAIGLLWIGAGAASWFQLLNGALATWVETALLFVAAYWFGCVCAAALRKPTAKAPAAAQD